MRGCVEEAFVARLPEGFTPTLSDEHDAWAFHPPAEAALIPRYPGLRRAIRLATASTR
jgi:hypothetical protein